MTFEEIVSVAVEARVRALIDEAITIPPSPDGYTRTSKVEQEVELYVSEIARDEVKKHETAIRSAIATALAGEPRRVEISAYTKIEIPKVSAL